MDACFLSFFVPSDLFATYLINLFSPLTITSPLLSPALLFLAIPRAGTNLLYTALSATNSCLPILASRL